MASSTPHKIVLSDHDFVQLERIAANVAITPGMLLEVNSSDQFALHSTSGGNMEALFAIENPYDDDLTVAAIDSAYGTADTVRAIKGQSGDVVYGWLTVGGSVNTGDYLISAGSLGAFAIYTGGTALAPARVRCRAAETVDNSAGGAAVRLKVEVI